MNSFSHLQELTKIQVLNTPYSLLVTVETSRNTPARSLGFGNDLGNFQREGIVWSERTPRLLSSRSPHCSTFPTTLVGVVSWSLPFFILYIAHIICITYTRYTHHFCFIATFIIYIRHPWGKGSSFVIYTCNLYVFFDPPNIRLKLNRDHQTCKTYTVLHHENSTQIKP